MGVDVCGCPAWRERERRPLAVQLNARRPTKNDYNTQHLNTNTHTHTHTTHNTQRGEGRQFKKGSEPLCDALLFEPIPYRSVDVYIYIYMCVCVCMCVCICVLCLFIYICVCVYRCMHMDICMLYFIGLVGKWVCVSLGGQSTGGPL
jgi:hypothetical protein